MGWFDDFDLAQWVEDRKKDYEEIDRNLGGWLPGGAETQGNDVPIISGLEAAAEQAWSPTEQWKAVQEPTQVDEAGDIIPRAQEELGGVMQGHLSAPVRDMPVVGGLSRVPEFALNALNQASERTWQPFWGELQSRNRGQQMEQAGEEDWGKRQMATLSESPQQAWDRMAAAAHTLVGSSEERKAAIEKGRAMGTGTQLLGAVLDPTNLVGIPGALKPTALKRGAMAARAIKPMEELSTAERLLSGTAKLTAEQMANAGPEAFRQKNVLTRFGSKVPIIGRPLAALTDLTPKSKMLEDIATITDTIVGRSGNALRDVGPDANRMVDNLAQVVADIKAPTEVAVQKMGQSAKAAPTRITAKYLEGFDPTKIVNDWQKGQDAIAEVERLRGDLKLGKAIDQTALAKAEKIAANAPKNVEEAIAQYGRDIIDHASKKAEAIYGVKEGISDKIIALQKNILGMGMLAANPNYPITNATNNLIMTALAGYSPFRLPGKSEGVMREAGLLVKGKGTQFSPSRAAAAMGMADMESLGSWKSKTFLGGAQKVEKIQGEGLWSQAFEKYIAQAKHVLFPPDMLGPQLRQSLDRIDPRLAGWVEDAARNGSTPADAIKKINSLPGMKAGAWLPDLVSLMPNLTKDDDELRAFLKAGVLNPYQDRLMAAKNINEFSAIIAEAKAKLAEMRGKAATLDFEGRPGAANAVLDFVEKYANAHNAGMLEGVNIRKPGVATEIVDLADNFGRMRQEMEGLVDDLTKNLAGALPEEKVASVKKAFGNWQKKTQEFEDAKLALATKFGGTDSPKYKAAYEELGQAYTKSMPKVRTAANAAVRGLLGDLFDASGMAPEKKALWNAYWTKAFNPMKQEELGITLYASQKKLTDTPLAELAKTNEYHAWRQEKWQAANDEMAKMRQELFGERPTPTASPMQTAAGDNPYMRYATLKWDTFDKALDEMLANASQLSAQKTAGQADSFTRREVLNTIQKQGQNYTDARLAAIAKANADRDFAMLNYSHKYGFDHYLSVAMPFAFWQNATMKNMAVRFMEQPGLFFAYSKYKQILNDSETAPGFPARLRGMLRVGVPGVPAWMGDQFVDVLGKALPFNQMMYPLQSAQWAGEDQSSLMGELGSVSPMWTIPANLASGKAKEIGALLPATRQIKAATALYKEAGKPGAEKIPAGGFNIEGGMRQALQGVAPGLPMIDQWDNYRVDRMLANMVKMGEITAQEATLAIRDKQGPAWDRATQKAAVESGVGQLPILSGLVTAKTYPKGEEQLKADSAGLNDLVMSVAAKALGRPPKDLAEAWDTVDAKKLAAKGSEISKWYADHPASSVRSLATTEESQQGNKADTSLTWSALMEGTVPSKWKAANLSKEEQATLQKFYDAGNVDGLTTAERTMLQGVVAKIEAGRGTPEFQNFAVLGKEINDLIDQEFARLKGPAGVEDKYGWIKQQNGGKTTAVIAKWYADHPGYTSGSTSTTSTTYAPAGAGKDPVLYREITDLIDREFQRLGGPAGTTDKYGWIKQANGGKTTPAISKWYQDHPGYSSSSSTSTYKPYAKSAFKIYAGSELKWLVKWDAVVAKAFKAYAKGGKMSPDLAQKLYTIWAKNKGILTMATFEAWVASLLRQAQA